MWRTKKFLISNVRVILNCVPFASQRFEEGNILLVSKSKDSAQIFTQNCILLSYPILHNLKQIAKKYIEILLLRPKIVFMKYYYSLSSQLKSEVHLFMATGFLLFDEFTKVLLAIKGLCVIIKKTKITDLWFQVNHPQRRTKNVLKIY